MVEDGVLSASKAEMMSLIKSPIERQYRRYEMDVTADEVECIAATALEIGSVDVAEIYSPHRFSARAEEFTWICGRLSGMVARWHTVGLDRSR